MIPTLYALFLVCPYCLYSLFIGGDFATGWRSYYAAAWQLALGIDACARVLPGKQERRVFALVALLPWSLAAALWFSQAGAGQYHRWATEYYVITGACGIGALQCAMAAAYRIWRGER